MIKLLDLFFKREPFEITLKGCRLLVNEHGNIERLDLHKLEGPSKELTNFINKNRCQNNQ